MRYKAIFLDFYGTVSAGDAEVVHRTCAQIVEDLGLPMSADEFAVAWGERFFATVDACNAAAFRTLYECECDSLAATVAPLCGPIDPKPYVANLTEYWRKPPLQPEAAEALASLELPICCVSNADTEDIASAIAHHGLRFANLITSEDARCYKPAPAIFERALRAMEVRPSEVVHVGDSLHSDIGGAARLRISTVWVCREPRIHDIGRDHPNHKISSLSELHDILAQ